MNGKTKSFEGYTKERLFREARKIVDVLSNWGNCLVPSIFEDGSDTSARQRLVWLVVGAEEKFGMSMEDIQEGIDSLDQPKEKT
jgi:hypothetical protein